MVRITESVTFNYQKILDTRGWTRTVINHLTINMMQYEDNEVDEKYFSSVNRLNWLKYAI